MKNNAIFWTFLFLAIRLNGQIFIDAMDYDCPKSSYKYSLLFMEKIKGGSISEAVEVVNDWEKKCGRREVVVRSQFLLAILSQEYEFQLPDDMVEYLIDFVKRDTLRGLDAKFAYEAFPIHYAYIPVNEEFDQFTKTFFKEHNEIGDLEFDFILKVYSGDHSNFYRDLESEQMMSSSIVKNRNFTSGNVFYPRHRMLYPVHLSYYSGIWSPLNANTVVGNKLEMGVQYGIKSKRWTYDLNLAVRFLKSKSKFRAYDEFNEEYKSTSFFVPVLFSFETGYSIIKSKKNELNFSIGAGVDFTTIFPETKQSESTTLESYNFYPAIKYRYYFKKEQYIGLRTNFNIVNYKLGNIVDFNERPLSITIEYGVFSEGSYY